MLDAYAENAGQSGRVIVRHVMPGMCVHGSDDMFEIIIENLLDNALSFTPEGSEVSVALTRQGDNVILAVGDRGPGVNSGDLERIFERYFSDRRAMPAAGTGTEPGDHFGMGLWIVRRNIESIDGAIHAENRPGGGLELRATIPLAD
jgi:two-component system sensor histidine kinase ChvG